MTPRESHKKFTTFQQGIEKKFLPQVLAVLQAEIAKFIATGINVGNTHSINLTELYPILNNMYYQCGYGYGWSIYKEYANVKTASIAIQTKAETEEVTPTSLAEEVVRILRLSLAVNVNEMSNSVKDRILQLIQMGFEQGWGYDETARKCADVASHSRALRIVRTESVKASNLSGITGAKKTGLLMDKRWISARNNRVRGNPAGKYPAAEFDHWKINGTVIGIDREFTETGEPMAYPGDPKGSAGDVINCRCSLGFVPKRDARGRPIRIAPGFFSSQTANMYPV